MLNRIPIVQASVARGDDSSNGDDYITILQDSIT
jgi:hypothetical protein